MSRIETPSQLISKLELPHSVCRIIRREIIKSAATGHYNDSDINAILEASNKNSLLPSQIDDNIKTILAEALKKANEQVIIAQSIANDNFAQALDRANRYVESTLLNIVTKSSFSFESVRSEESLDKGESESVEGQSNTVVDQDKQIEGQDYSMGESYKAIEGIYNITEESDNASMQEQDPEDPKEPEKDSKDEGGENKEERKEDKEEEEKSEEKKDEQREEKKDQGEEKKEDKEEEKKDDKKEERKEDKEEEKKGDKEEEKKGDKEEEKKEEKKEEKQAEEEKKEEKQAEKEKKEEKQAEEENKGKRQEDKDDDNCSLVMKKCDCSDPCSCENCPDKHPNIPDCNCPDECECIGCPLKPGLTIPQEALCTCVKCYCDPCQDKNRMKGSVAETLKDCTCKDVCTCDKCQSKKPSCNCEGECICIVCPYIETKCNCAICLCDDCPKMKPKPTSCECAICLCECCPKGGDKLEKSAQTTADQLSISKCRCAVCLCENCQAVKKHTTTCDCAICLCENCKANGKPKDECTCYPICKCQKCEDPTVVPEPTKTSDNCTNCVCSKGTETKTDRAKPNESTLMKITTTTNIKEAENCKCLQCACNPCISTHVVKSTTSNPQTDKPSKCTCSQCQCKPCIFKSTSIDEHTETHGDGCKCFQCVCNPCTFKPTITSPQSDKSSKLSPQTDNSLRCTCSTCQCKPCVFKSTSPQSDKPSKSSPQTDNPSRCTCSTCQCKPCAFKSTRIDNHTKTHRDGCKCLQCACNPCTFKSSPQTNKPSKCTCSQCECKPCTFKSTSNDQGDTHAIGCKCLQCACKLCPFKPASGDERATLGAGCKCLKCTCTSCAFKLKNDQNNRSFIVGKEIQCCCQNCTNQLCPTKKSKVKETRFGNIEHIRGGGSITTNIPDKQCTCLDPCTCIKCVKDRTDLTQKSKIQQKFSFENIAPCSCVGQCTCALCPSKKTSTSCLCSKPCTCVSCPSKTPANPDNTDNTDVNTKDTTAIVQNPTEKIKTCTCIDPCKCIICPSLNTKIETDTKPCTCPDKCSCNKCPSKINDQNKACGCDGEEDCDIRCPEKRNNKVVDDNTNEQKFPFEIVKECNCVTPCNCASCPGVNNKNTKQKASPLLQRMDTLEEFCKKQKNITLAMMYEINIDKHEQPKVPSFRIFDIRKLTEDTLLLKWEPANIPHLTGYEIDVNGKLTHSVKNKNRCIAVLFNMNFNQLNHINVYPVTKNGRLLPATSLLPIS